MFPTSSDQTKSIKLNSYSSVSHSFTMQAVPRNMRNKIMNNKANKYINRHKVIDIVQEIKLTMIKLQVT